VTVKNYSFRPNLVTLQPNEYLKWHFQQGTHAVNFYSHHKIPYGISSNPTSSGYFSVRFSEVGVFEYICSIHPSMRGTVVVTGSATATPTATPSLATQIPGTFTPTATPAPNVFTIGSTLPEVKIAMGDPDGLELTGRKYVYGSSSVIFHPIDWSVLSWNNSGGNLALKERIPTGQNIDFGLTREEVLRILGNPNSFDNDGLKFLYGQSSISFGTESEKVLSWDNFGGNLTFPDIAFTIPTFTLGTPRLDVLNRTMGYPERISADGQTYYYGDSSITFDIIHQRVVGWNNGGLNLKFPAPTDESGMFYIGSSLEQVFDVMGHPDHAISEGMILYYGTSRVILNIDTRTVVSFDNSGGNLKVP
tara:strand:+ start:160 stop:1245 length:1086 start_codon:yes stop_codon:yes gene_type:complete